MTKLALEGSKENHNTLILKNIIYKNATFLPQDELHEELYEMCFNGS
jgi:hypothetical protein